MLVSIEGMCCWGKDLSVRFERLVGRVVFVQPGTVLTLTAAAVSNEQGTLDHYSKVA